MISDCVKSCGFLLEQEEIDLIKKYRCIDARGKDIIDNILSIYRLRAENCIIINFPVRK